MEKEKAKQRTEIRGQRTEDGGQKTEDGVKKLRYSKAEMVERIVVTTNRRF